MFFHRKFTKNIIIIIIIITKHIILLDYLC